MKPRRLHSATTSSRRRAGVGRGGVVTRTTEASRARWRHFARTCRAWSSCPPASRILILNFILRRRLEALAGRRARRRRSCRSSKRLTPALLRLHRQLAPFGHGRPCARLRPAFEILAGWRTRAASGASALPAQLLGARLDLQLHRRLVAAELGRASSSRAASCSPPPPPPVAPVQSTRRPRSSRRRPSARANVASKISGGGTQMSRVATISPPGPPANVSVNVEIGMSGRPSKVTTLRPPGVEPEPCPCSFSASGPRRSTPMSGRPGAVGSTSATGPVSGSDSSGEVGHRLPTIERRRAGAGREGRPRALVVERVVVAADVRRAGSPAPRSSPASSIVCAIVVLSSTARSAPAALDPGAELGRERERAAVGRVEGRLPLRGLGVVGRSRRSRPCGSCRRSGMRMKPLRRGAGQPGQGQRDR